MKLNILIPICVSAMIICIGADASDDRQKGASVESAQTIAAAPRISDVAVSKITDKSAQVTWSLDQPATGVIKYGGDILSSTTTAEVSFKYSAHRQTLLNLEPETEYFFQVVSSNRAGKESRSKRYSLTTKSEEQAGNLPSAPRKSAPLPDPDKTILPRKLTISRGSPSPGWPELVYDSLPLAGIFYGNYKAGLMSGNSPLAHQNAIRFRAERTGMVNAIRYNNRRILPSDIAHRCGLYGEGSLWCECEDNDLDNRSCGYTLPNAYHVGSGGLITVELREDDASDLHLPGERVLAKTQLFEPAEIADKFPTLALNENVIVKAGEIYHLVFQNDKPPTCDVRNLSVADAADCPRDEGAISLNGTKHSSDESEGSRFGPFLGDISGRVLYKPSTDSAWRVHKDVIAFYELKYTDEEYVGNSYTGFDNRSYDEQTGGSHVIEGDVIARQVFTVHDATREVDGLWLNYGHAYDRPANGKNLDVVIRSADGKILATSMFPASRACSERAQAGAAQKAIRATRDEWMCRTWGYAELSRPISLKLGAAYSVDLSAPDGAAYALSSYFSVHRLPERNIWGDASAQISRDGGMVWDSWTMDFFPSRDLPLLFTITGMPRELP